MDAGQIPLAQSQFQQILQHAPEQFDALHTLGVLAMRQQNFPQAVDLIGRAWRKTPEFATAQLNMGLPAWEPIARSKPCPTLNAHWRWNHRTARPVAA